METVLITSFHPVSLRNVLLTDALRTLPADTRVVALVPHYKKSYYESVLGSEVIVEGVGFDSPSKSFMTLVFKRASRLALDTHTARIEKWIKWKREGKFFYYVFASLWGKLLAHSKILRRLLRVADRVCTSTHRYREIFDRYEPSLVVSTDIEQERDVEVLQYAKRRGTRTLGIVRNWDNLTSHGLLRIHPDILVVPSPELRRQAIELNDMPQNRVRLVGSPHLDRWASAPQTSREEFCAARNFDPTKPIILLALIGDWYIPDNDTDPYLLELAASWDANVVARFHPTVESKALANATPAKNMVFDRPGISFIPGHYEDRVLDTGDNERLFEEIYYADVVVCGPTTLSLEAMLLGKPVVLIDFHRTPRELRDGIIKYACDHFVFVLRHDAAVRATSPRVLNEALAKFLANPDYQRAGRQVVAGAYGGPFDGHSGARLAEEIRSALNL